MRLVVETKAPDVLNVSHLKFRPLLARISPAQARYVSNGSLFSDVSHVCLEAQDH